MILLKTSRIASEKDQRFGKLFNKAFVIDLQRNFRFKIFTTIQYQFKTIKKNNIKRMYLTQLKERKEIKMER